MKTAVVIPTCRPASFNAWWQAWRPLFGRLDELIVVEDSPARTFEAPTAFHYSHAEIEETLGGDAWIISRRDSAIRAFGYLIAWREGFELIVTLDDDCFPTEHFRGPLGRDYRRAMRFERWQESIPGMRTRGLPYADLGSLESYLHIGLWRNVPDVDAIGALSALAARQNAGGFEPPAGRRVMAPDQFFPLCGMNLAFLRELAPAMYFPLMGAGQPFARFDDIWGGVICQKICRHLRLPISLGEPHVEHRRASCPFVNLVKEAPGVAANERFWRTVDACPLSASSIAGCAAEVGKHLAAQGDDYLRKLGAALTVWASLFD